MSSWSSLKDCLAAQKGEADFRHDSDLDQLVTDVLIAGSGIAGLSAAMSAAESGARVTLIANAPASSPSISVVNTWLGDYPEDTSDGLLRDILRAGAGINHPSTAALMAERVGDEIERLLGLGVQFCQSASEGSEGRLLRRRGAGSSAPRGVFTAGMVGFDIRSVLSRRIGSLDGVRVLRNMALVDVSLKDGAIAGAIVYNHHAGRWLFVNVPTVVLATGGLGGLFEMSTNHPDNLGVAYSIALAAGAVLTDLEFVSFEPFVLQSPVELRGTSLPTTAVTEGCRILDNRGGSLFEGDGLPTKDEICRHMIRLAEEGDGSGVRNFIYDSSELPAAELEHYPKIKHAMTIAAGRPLCVMPAQHFLDGGIRVDEFGTSTVAGLYAVGEAAGGAHGAHRLAGCGGSEVVALGPVVGRAAAQFAMSSDRSPAEAFVPVWELLPDWRRSPLVDDTRAAVTSALSYGCGPMRDAGRLASAGLQVAEQMERLKAGGLEKSFAGRSVRLAAAMITSSALRKESRGDHFRCDHPECDDSWCGNLDVIQDSPLAEVRHRYRAAQGPRPTAVQAHVNDPAGSVNP